MDLSGFPFTLAETLFIVGYVLCLLLIGWLGMRAQKEHTLREFYLAGRGVGLLVLLLTLYATQYSGNTLFGFTGKTYREGYSWAVCIHFMTAIIVFYLLFAPKLHRLSRARGYITPTDYLHDRFQSTPLNVAATGLMIVALANYLLAQLKALGEALEGFFPSQSDTAYTTGVIILALIVVVYESLGGFRAVAWTDVIQGTVLMVGFAVLLWLVFGEFGTLQAATETLLAESPEKVAPPDATGARNWLSWILIVGVGGVLYPQAIQRLYAAKDATSLRRSLAVMAFLPLTTTLIAVTFGVMAAANLPETVQGDEVLTVVCRRIQEQSLLGRWLVVVLFSGILAALMSTADSVLLSISSMVTKDIYARYVDPDASQRRLTWIGRICSWTTIALMTWAAIALRNQSLVQLLRVKFELLVQPAPAFFIGIHWRRLSGIWVFLGLLLGVLVAVPISLRMPGGVLWGVHAGIYGLALNMIVAVGGSLLSHSPSRQAFDT